MTSDRRYAVDWRVGLVIASVSFLLVLVAAEIGFRLTHVAFGIERDAISNMRIMVLGGRSAFYVPRAFTNFGLRPGHGINERGFVGWSGNYPLEKSKGAIRIACLGASTTQGGNGAGVAGSYPYQLQQILSAEAVERVEVMNFGVSGWTTAETLVNFALTVRDYSPDLVVIHHGINDVAPRLYADYRNDYTHYRTAWTPPRYSFPTRAAVRVSDLATWLLLHTGGPPHLRQVVVRPREGPIPRDGEGNLDPRTAVGFRRNVQTIADMVRVQEGRTILLTMPHSQVPGHTSEVQRTGLDEHNRILRELVSEPDRLLADAAEAFPSETDPDRSVFRDAVHVSPEGNLVKARVVADALFEADWLTKRTP